METETLGKLRSALETEKTRLEEELSRIAAPTDIPGEYEARFEDIGDQDGDSETEVEQYVDILGVEATLEKNLADVREALDRMEKKVYGVCPVCSEDISEERLMAYPAAKRCMRCAQKSV